MSTKLLLDAVHPISDTEKQCFGSLKLFFHRQRMIFFVFHPWSYCRRISITLFFYHPLFLSTFRKVLTCLFGLFFATKKRVKSPDSPKTGKSPQKYCQIVCSVAGASGFLRVAPVPVFGSDSRFKIKVEYFPTNFAIWYTRHLLGIRDNSMIVIYQSFVFFSRFVGHAFTRNNCHFSNFTKCIVQNVALSCTNLLLEYTSILRKIVLFS